MSAGVRLSLDPADVLDRIILHPDYTFACSTCPRVSSLDDRLIVDLRLPVLLTGYVRPGEQHSR